jgi:hypothetical protein
MWLPAGLAMVLSLFDVSGGVIVNGHNGTATVAQFD